MGFFDFIKGAGKEPEKPEPVQRDTAMSAAEKQQVNDRRIAMGIAKHVERLKCVSVQWWTLRTWDICQV